MTHERRSFKAMIEIAPKTVLVTEAEGDVLKAEFRSYPGHTRALLFILEGRVGDFSAVAATSVKILSVNFATCPQFPPLSGAF